MKKKYVVLEHITLPDRGLRFWSTNSDNNTKLFTGEVVYKEVLFTNSIPEAVKEASIINESILPSHSELCEYYKNEDHE